MFYSSSAACERMGSNGHEERMEAVALVGGGVENLVRVQEGMKYENQTATAL